MLQPDSQLYTPCTEMSVVQMPPNGALSGPYECELRIGDGINVDIQQIIGRRIDITATPPRPCFEVFNSFQDLETLLMLFDGMFYPIEKIIFEDGREENTVKFSGIVEELLAKRLNFFESRDFCMNGFLSLLQFQDVLTEERFNKWINLRKQLDIAYSVFMYSLSDSKMPVDTNFAFLVELAEPFVELLKENSGFYQELSPGEKGTSLKKCISAIIGDFGKDIFSKEMNGDYESFLRTTVDSRVRIMHIKKNQPRHFSGKDCVRYSMKFSLLYRRILLDLLDVPYESYIARIRHAVQVIDEWLK